MNSRIIFLTCIAIAWATCCSGQSLAIKLGAASVIPIRPLPAFSLEYAISPRLSLEAGFGIIGRKGGTGSTYFIDDLLWLSGRYYFALNRGEQCRGVFVAPQLTAEQSHWRVRNPGARLSSDLLLGGGITAGIQLPVLDRGYFQAQAGMFRQFFGQRRLFDQDNKHSSTQQLPTDFNLFFNTSIGYRLFRK